MREPHLGRVVIRGRQFRLGATYRPAHAMPGSSPSTLAPRTLVRVGLGCCGRLVEVTPPLGFETPLVEAALFARWAGEELP